MSYKSNLIFFIALAVLIEMACETNVQEGEQKVKVRGEVQSVPWDDQDNRTGLIIVPVQDMENDEELIVADTREGRELITHVGEQVEVDGTVRKNEYGGKMIYVHSYTRLEIPPGDESLDLQ